MSSPMETPSHGGAAVATPVMAAAAMAKVESARIASNAHADAVASEVSLKLCDGTVSMSGTGSFSLQVDSDDEHDDVWAQMRRMNTNSAFVDRLPFQLAIGFVIILNAVVMGFEADMDLGYVGVIFQNIFTITWILEMLLKIFTLGVAAYFKDPWNCMDSFLAGLSVLDTWLLAADGSGVGMLVNLRLLRLLRLCRLVKLLRLFRELWLLVHGMIGAARVLLWVCILLLVVLYIGALVMTEQVGHECDDTYENFKECYQMFGTMFRSMCTLFQLITLESWAMAIARPIMEEKWYMIFFFGAFLYITTFGLMNIVMGVIVEQTMSAAQDNAEKETATKRQAQKREIKMVRKIFISADEDHDGMISMEDFVNICENEEVRAAFELMDLPVSRARLAQRLFEVLDWDGQGKIAVDKFLRAICSLKDEGHVLDRDKTLLLMEVRHLTRRLMMVESSLDAGLTGMESRIFERLGSFQKEVHSRVGALEMMQSRWLGGADSPVSSTASLDPLLHSSL